MADKLTLDERAMKDKATQHLRIYVGLLTKEASVDALYNHFIEYGEIDGIVITYCFGFVQFRQESSTLEAIEKANGSIFQGKPIVVSAAQSNKHKKEAKMVNEHSKMPELVGSPGNLPINSEEAAEEHDKYGNYVGEQRGERRNKQPQPKSSRVLPVPLRIDVVIIIISEHVIHYAQYIQERLKGQAIVADLLRPKEGVPISKVLGEIASKGSLYAILVTPLNMEYRSVTLTILHGIPEEHRNMPIEDALKLLSRNYQEVQRGKPFCRETDGIFRLHDMLAKLADKQTLTVPEYDKVIEYLKECREQQVKMDASLTTNKTLLDRLASKNPLLNDSKVREAIISALEDIL